MKTRNKILVVFLALLVIIQFISIREEVDMPNAKNITEMHETSLEVITLLEKSCYDCHSTYTEFPWYASIAPVSWYIDDHVNEGRGHLNFDAWSTYSIKKADHKLDECIEEVEEKEMPLEEYTWLHSESKLSNEEREILIEYFREIRKSYVGKF